MQMMQ
jgi:hypothetical protein